MQKRTYFKTLLSFLFLCILLIPVSFELRGSTATGEFLTKIFGKNVAIANSSGCSEHIGNATINEVYKSGTDYFIELKIIEDLSQDLVEEWEVEFCSDHGCKTVQLDSLDDEYWNDSWIVIPEDYISNKSYINLKKQKGMEILLRDNSNAAIDYFDVGSYSGPLSSSCSFEYDTTMDGTTSHIAERIPDGTGDWKETGPGGSEDPTRGGSNVGNVDLGYFNVVEVESDPVDGPLYTKIAGKEFNVDVVRLAPFFPFPITVDLELVEADPSTDCEDLNQLSDLGAHTISRYPPRETIEDLSYKNAIGAARIRVKYFVSFFIIQSCSQDIFSVRPAYLSLNATDLNRGTPGTNRTLDGDNSDICRAAGGTDICHKAGLNFTVQGTAYNDNSAIVSSGYDPVADVDWELNAPNASSGGRLGLNRKPNSLDFDGSKNRTDKATYSEVGLVDLSLNDEGNFAAQSADKTNDHCISDNSTNTQNSNGKYGCQTATRQDITVGRFVPDHLITKNASLTNRSHISSCSEDFRNFTYLGEPWSLEFKIVAKNNQTETTENYINDFARLPIDNSTYNTSSDPGLHFSAVHNPSNKSYYEPPKTLTDRIDIDNITGNFTQGTADISLNGTITRNSTEPDGPFEDFRLGFNPIDEDNIKMTGTPDLNSTLNNGNDTYELVDGDIRYGRLNIENAYGSELFDLEVPIKAEYYDGDGFTINKDDWCTRLTIDDSTDYVKMELKNETVGWQPANQTIGLSGRESSGSAQGEGLKNTIKEAHTLQLDAGKAALVLNATGKNNTGYAYVQANLTEQHWLRFDWSDNGNYTDYPNATATFGIFRGNEHIIYQQETW